MRSGSSCFVLIIGFLLTAPCHASENPAQQVLISASDLVDIQAAGAKRFQMEVDFRVQALVMQEGHLTFKWGAKDLWSQEIVMGPYRQKTVRNGETVYISRNAPFTPLPIHRLLELVPIFRADDYWQGKRLQQRPQDGASIRCVDLQAQPGRHNRRPKREICVDAAMQVLSDETRDDTEVTRKEFAGYQPFLDHRYPRQWKLFSNGSLVAQASVVSLQEAAFDLMTFVPPSGALERRQCEHMVAPVALKAPDPVYPKSSAENGIMGTTTAAVTVLADGSVGDIQLIGSAGRQMDEEATKTLKTWKFKPAMCGNEPVVFDVTVDVNFKLIR